MDEKNLLSKRLKSRHNDAYFSNKTYDDWQTKTDSLCSVNQLINEMELKNFKEFDEVMIAHSPSQENEELTKVFSSYKQIGTLSQSLSFELLNKFGKNFVFYGVIYSKNIKVSPVNNIKYLNITIKFDIPFI
ncbi:MAG: hypothetical protein WCR30_02465 [Clostridia bacterium]